MTDVRDLVSTGVYAKKQLRGRLSLLAWSHRRRFGTALRLVRPYAGRRLLDYGCGDGTFLAYAHAMFPDSLGADVDPRLVADCATRFASLAGLSFVHADELAARPAGSVDVILCTEVLEHCTAGTVEGILPLWRRLLARDGALVVSVPVETGLPLLVKQAVRALVALRGDATYRQRERYGWGELLRMVAAGETTRIERPAYRQDFAADRPNVYHGHKGFNWRALRRTIGEQFVVERTLFSPLNVRPAGVGAQCASQAWFVCRPR